MTAPAAPAPLGGGLLYSQCWEDSDVARAALRIRPGQTVLAIAAAGDNAMALLQDDPGRIIAVDVAPAQTALAQLKIAAVRTLVDPEPVGGFLGAGPSTDRTATYAAVRRRLPPDAQRFWDDHQPLIDSGVIHAGRFERYLSHFRRLVLPIVPGKRAVVEMLRATNLDDQRRIYRETWDSRRWRLLFKFSFSRALLARFGRDPAFFAQCEIEDIGTHFLARARYALTTLPIWTNPYLTYMLSGSFGAGRRVPDYLGSVGQSLIRTRCNRVTVQTASLDAALMDMPSSSVDAFYLSDVFELSSTTEYASTLAEIARVGRPGARICYWNNLVTRRRPDELAHEILSHPDQAQTLHAQDRAFLYSGLVVESVRGGAT